MHSGSGPSPGRVPRLRIEVCYAQAQRQVLVPLDLPEGATAGDALAASGLGSVAKPLLLAVFGRRVSLEARLRHGDRVDILRPLAADPKEARRQRARRTKR
jgi:putative ubiquitin-RnfH superfamily antitoxin RatB of RatAB toxin-antitoxin module